MKSILFHQQGYRELPGTVESFRKDYPSNWVTFSNEHCDPKKAGQYLRDSMDELLYADSLGFDAVGTNEHHQNGYGYPSPHLTGAMLASHDVKGAICLLGSTLSMHHPFPMKAAQELAIIDCMSSGRLISGWVVGSAQDTAGNAGIPTTQVRQRFEEAHDYLKKAWTTPGPYTFNGRFTQQRYANPWPRPLQQPHPPIWLTGTGSLETFKFVAENNYTYSYVSYWGMDAARAKMKRYWDALEMFGADDNPYRAGFAQLVGIADTDAEAKRLYWPYMQDFLVKYLHTPAYFGNPPGYLSRESMSDNLMATGTSRPQFTEHTSPTFEDVTESGMFLVGSPETVAQKLEAGARELRFGHFISLAQWGSMPSELIKYNLKHYAEGVIPRIRGMWSGYEDHWWPSGATVPNAAPAEAMGADR